jgi:hypothetical protein
MFNENKYKKCVNHLIAIKASIVIGYLAIFALIGAGIGIPIMKQLTNQWYTIVIASTIGGVLGLIIGLFSTWQIEMKIQEAYWRIDLLNELKKQNSSKSAIAKTVVAIENNQGKDSKSKIVSKES